MISSSSPSAYIMRIFNRATIKIPISHLKNFLVVEHYIKDDTLVIELKNISDNRDAFNTRTLGSRPSDCYKQQDRSSLLK